MGRFKFARVTLLKEKAIEQGVPEKDILVEDLSLHTKENVLSSMLVLDRAFDLHNIKRVIVVTTAFHMRRLYLTLKTYMPGWIEFTLCAVNDRTSRIDNWFKTDCGRSKVESETSKLIDYVKKGVIVDDYVDLTESHHF
ncbi:YdcF family protein [Alkalibacillus silvisoli]|uniref:DUF218 domain-containing protein n=1 Tax=Alkalibacillus silvisoli TaxID=392823 RepID=A0ABN0ZYU0_9BACI